MLDISFELLFLSIIAFLLLLVFLNYFLYKPLTKHMDERSFVLQNQFEEAKSISTEIENLLLESEKILAKAKQQANNIREDAAIKAQEKIKILFDDEYHKSQNMYYAMQEDIKELETKIKKDLLKMLPQYQESIQKKILSYYKG